MFVEILKKFWKIFIKFETIKEKIVKTINENLEKFWKCFLTNF